MLKHAVPALPQASVPHRAAATRRPVGTVLKRTVGRGVDTLLLWQDRARQRYRLRQFDDRMLADIGLTSADVHRESAKPFWHS